MSCYICPELAYVELGKYFFLKSSQATQEFLHEELKVNGLSNN